jgi:DNA-binding MarR family transcriptional regulator
MTDETYPAALEIRLLATLVAKTARRDLEQRLTADDCCVGALPYSVLRLLAAREQTLSNLSRTLLVTPATLVPVVDTLERNGLAVRGRDPQDRRRTPLSLTEQGAALLARIPLVAGSDSLVRAVEALGPEGHRQLLQLLRTLVSNLAAGGRILEDIAGTVRALDNRYCRHVEPCVEEANEPATF